MLASVHGVTGLICVILHCGMAGEPRSTLSLPLPVPTGAYHLFVAAVSLPWLMSAIGPVDFGPRSMMLAATFAQVPMLLASG